MRISRSSKQPTFAIRSFQPELRVIEYVATRRGDEERGPQVRLCSKDARLRLLTEGELVWIQSERGQQLAELVIDDMIPEHGCGLRDIPGVLVSEAVYAVKPDLDNPPRTRA